MYQQKGGSYIGDGDPGHKLSCRDAPRFSPFSAESRFSPTSKTYSHSSPPKAECCKMQTCWLIAGIRMTAGCWAFMQTRAQIRQRHQPWIAILQLIMHLTLPFTTLKSSSRYCNVDSTKILRGKKCARIVVAPFSGNPVQTFHTLHGGFQAWDFSVGLCEWPNVNLHSAQNFLPQRRPACSKKQTVIHGLWDQDHQSRSAGKFGSYLSQPVTQLHHWVFFLLRNI